MRRKAVVAALVVAAAWLAAPSARAGLCVSSPAGSGCFGPGPDTRVSVIPGCCVWVESDGPVPMGRSGITGHEDPSGRPVITVWADWVPVAELILGNDIQRLGFGSEDQYFWVKNQMGSNVEVDAEGRYLSLDRTGLFGDQYYLILYVDGRKTVICPWDSSGPHLDRCTVDLPR